MSLCRLLLQVSNGVGIEMIMATAEIAMHIHFAVLLKHVLQLLLTQGHQRIGAAPS